jgi:hypothetical protein
MKSLTIEKGILLTEEDKPRRGAFRFLEAALEEFPQVVILSSERGRTKRALMLAEIAERRVGARGRLVHKLEFAGFRPPGSFLVALDAVGVREGQFPRPSSLA